MRKVQYFGLCFAAFLLLFTASIASAAQQTEKWCQTAVYVVTLGAEALALYDTAQTPDTVSRADHELQKALSKTSGAAGWALRTPKRYPAAALPLLETISKETKVPAPNRLDRLSRAPFEDALLALATLASPDCSDPILIQFARS